MRKYLFIRRFVADSRAADKAIRITDFAFESKF